MPPTPTHRDGVTLDLVSTKSEKYLDDVNVDAPNIPSDHSLFSWRLQLIRQSPIIADREVRSWKRVDKDKFREALLQSELCKPDQRPGTVEEYFDVYYNTLQSLADEFAPALRRVTIRRQRLAIWMDEQCFALRRKSRMLERRYRRTQKSEDRLAGVEHERKRHSVYRQK